MLYPSDPKLSQYQSYLRSGWNAYAKQKVAIESRLDVPPLVQITSRRASEVSVADERAGPRRRYWSRVEDFEGGTGRHTRLGRVP